MNKGKGNAGLADVLTEGLDAPAAAPISSPADSIMSSRSETLSKIASGRLVTDRTEFVDPSLCRPWKYHNRDLDHLNEESCRDLIDAFLSAKRQRLPAIVRYLKDDPDHKYEIIAGVRRWWTVQWLKANNHPEYDYLITIQKLTDEEAFRVSDIENRARKDITDWERAQEYLRALSTFYHGNQSQMAEHLNISKSWLSRLLDVARLPKDIVAAYSDPHDITIHYARTVKPLANNPAYLTAMVREAETIVSQRTKGDAIDGVAVTRRLVQATKAKEQVRTKAQEVQLRASSGKTMMTFRPIGRAGGMNIKIHPSSKATRAELEEAFRQALDAREKQF